MIEKRLEDDNSARVRGESGQKSCSWRPGPGPGRPRLPETSFNNGEAGLGACTFFSEVDWPDHHCPRQPRYGERHVDKEDNSLFPHTQKKKNPEAITLMNNIGKPAPFK